MMALVDAGTFLMGSADDEAGREDDEGPVREVTIEKSFALGRTEVKRAQFAVFVAETGRRIDEGCWYIDPESLTWRSDPERSWTDPGFPQTDDHPVTCVNWQDAEAYAVWLSEKARKTYRLPSEAEWEYAARAGTVSGFFWGEEEDEGCAYANAVDLAAAGVYRAWKFMNCNDGFVYTNPVGHYAPNPWGFFDMAGNLWEWVQDCWNPSHEGASGDASPRLGGECRRRVIRGAAWDDEPEDLRAANRLSVFADRRYNTIGIRVVRED